MFIFQKTAFSRQSKTEIDLFGILEKWAGQNGIQVTMEPNMKVPQKGFIFPADSLDFGYATGGILGDRVGITTRNPVVMLHESAHQFLMVKKNFFIDHYFDPLRLQQELDSLGMRSSNGKTAKGILDIQSYFVKSKIDAREQYPDALQKNSHLNDILHVISMAEEKLASERGISRKLSSVLGKPQQYSFRMSSDFMVQDIADGRGAGKSWVGNILDESTIFRIREKRLGHPMINYHEFFASFCTALTFDGPKMFEGMNDFHSLAKKEPAVSEIYEKFTYLLAESSAIAKEFLSDLQAIDASNSSPELANFKANIAKLDAWLERK